MADENTNEDIQTLEDGAVEQETLDAINFDPFGPDNLNPADATGEGSDGLNVSADDGSDTSEGTQGGDAPVKQPDASDDNDAAQAAGEPEPKKDDPANDADGAVEEINEGILALLATTTPQQAPQPAQQTQPATSAEAPADPKADDVPAYDFTVPPQLMSMIDSEVVAERQAGIQTLIKGVGQAVHRQVMEQVATKISQAEQQIAQTVQNDTMSAAAKQEIYNDYYGNFPAHNNPKLRTFIQNVTQQVVAETGAQGWTPELRNAIGARANELLRKAGVLTGGNAAAPANPTPPTATKSTTRGQTGKFAGDPNSPEAIADMMFG